MAGEIVQCVGHFPGTDSTQVLFPELQMVPQACQDWFLSREPGVSLEHSQMWPPNKKRTNTSCDSLRFLCRYWTSLFRNKAKVKMVKMVSFPLLKILMHICSRLIWGYNSVVEHLTCRGLWYAHCPQQMPSVVPKIAPENPNCHLRPFLKWPQHPSSGESSPLVISQPS